MKENDTMLICKIYIFGIIEAYIFGEYELAADMIRKKHEVEKKLSRKTTFYGLTDFYDGLVFLAMTRKTNDMKWMSEASKAMSKLESHVQYGKANCEHKLLLLQAESKSLLGENQDAFRKYELSIAVAEKNGFIHEQAIANERLGDFLQKNGGTGASQYYGISNSLYLQWGAQGKADHLCKNIPF